MPEPTTAGSCQARSPSEQICNTPGLREAWDAGDRSPFHGWDRRWLAMVAAALSSTGGAAAHAAPAAAALGRAGPSGVLRPVLTRGRGALAGAASAPRRGHR